MWKVHTNVNGCDFDVLLGRIVEVAVVGFYTYAHMYIPAGYNIDSDPVVVEGFHSV